MTDVVDFYASRPHYAEHLLPVWFALPEETRGTWFAPNRVLPAVTEAGVHPVVPGRPGHSGRPIAVASYEDLRTSRPRPAVLLNHGVGQTYGGDPRSAGHSAYSGGRGREGVVLFLCPSEEDAAACRAAQPNVPAAVVGCPYLDRWHSADFRPSDEGGKPEVAVSFHWDCRISPEARSAFIYYREVLRAFPDEFPDVHFLGHGHPRAWRQLEKFYETATFEPVERIEEVLERASVYLCDNSSTMYEAAAVGLHVVALNAPWYRRNVDHGLRFWSHVPGPQVDTPGDLAPALRTVLDSPAEAERLRVAAASRAYTYRDGKAAERAAEAITDVIAGLEVKDPRPLNPKAPRRAKRRIGEPSVPLFPERRLRRLGATDGVVGVATERWAAMSEEEQAEAVVELAGLTDNELRELILDTPVDTVVGVPGGSE